MRKMKTSAMKIGAIIFLFSLIITAAFSAMLSVFSGGFTEPSVTAIGTVTVPAQRQNIYTLTLAHVDGKCVIIVTHSKKVSRYADELWGLNQGSLTLVKGH